MKLRTRLYAGLGAVALAFAVTGFLVATTQQRYLTEQLDRELQSAVPVAMRVTDDRQGGPIPADDPSALLKLYVGHLAPDGTLTTLLVGETTTGTPSITPANAAAHAGRGQVQPFTVQGSGTDDRFRVIIVSRPNRAGWDVIALSLHNTDAAYQRLLIATAIGGLAVGEGQAAMFSVLDYAPRQLPADRPRYLMGVGKPDDIVGAVERGIDMFDCVLPTRSGRTGQAFTHNGPINLRNARHAEDEAPLDAACACPVCKTHSRAYIHHLIKSSEILGAMLMTEHNVWFYQQLMAGLRGAIAAGELTRFANDFRARYGGR